MPLFTSNSNDPKTFWTIERNRCAMHWWRSFWFKLYLPLSPLIFFLVLSAFRLLTYNEVELAETGRVIFSWRGLAGMVALQIIPVTMMVGLWVHRFMTFWMAEFAACILTLIIVGFAEFVSRQSRADWNILLASSIRPLPAAEDYPLRDRVMKQLLKIKHHGEWSSEGIISGISVFGSSQMERGIDYSELEERTNMDVYQRCLAGQFPLHGLVADSWLMMPKTSIIVMYVSPFDLSRYTTTINSWGRFFASRQSVERLRKTMGLPLVLGEWRSFAELYFSSVSRIWSRRDVYQKIAFSIFGAAPEKTTRSSKSPEMTNQVFADNNNMDARYHGASLRALENLWNGWTSQGIRVLVVEGDVNPLYRHEFDQYDPSFWRLQREAIRDAASKSGVIFIGAEDLQAEISADDWADSTHFNQKGVEKFTKAIARTILSLKPGPPSR